MEEQNNDSLKNISTKNMFMVENGFNTSYISSLLMAMFYKKSHIDSILYNDTKTTMFIYLQEIIKQKFVDKVRQGLSVMSDTINEIRIVAHACGWLNNDQLLDHQDINDFFVFIASNSNLSPLEICRTITNYNDDNHKKYHEQMLFINLNIISDDIETNETSIKKLLDTWQSNVIDNIQSNTYLVNIPMFMGIALNRHQNKDMKVDIQKKIKIKSINNDEIKWRIHSIICKSHHELNYETNHEPENNDHYYAIILNNNNEWYMFNDMNIPSLTNIDIKNPTIMNTIKHESVFVLYVFDDAI